MYIGLFLRINIKVMKRTMVFRDLQTQRSIRTQSFLTLKQELTSVSCK